MPDTTERPFSRDYVMRKTREHMLKSVDISIRKTFERLPEFEAQPERAREVFDTINELMGLRTQLDGLDNMKKDN